MLGIRVFFELTRPDSARAADSPASCSISGGHQPFAARRSCSPSTLLADRLDGVRVCSDCKKAGSFGSWSASSCPSRRNRVQRFGNQQVDIAIVQLQRREAGGIVAHVKSGAQRIVVLRYLAQRRDSCACGPGAPGWLSLLVRTGMQTAAMRRAAGFPAGPACVPRSPGTPRSTSVKKPPAISSASRVRRHRRRSSS